MEDSASCFSGIKQIQLGVEQKLSSFVLALGQILPGEISISLRGLSLSGTICRIRMFIRHILVFILAIAAESVIFLDIRQILRGSSRNSADLYFLQLLLDLLFID